MNDITVTFQPNTTETINYTVWGVNPSGGQFPIASGFTSGTVQVPVSGFPSYFVSAQVPQLQSQAEVDDTSTVTLVFGSQNDFKTILWLVFQHIGQQWGNAAEADMPEVQFNQVIDWQVELDPNYALYYAETISEYTKLLQQTGSSDAALKILFAENQKDAPKLPNVANFVLKEFMIWQVAFGGFRAFGPPYQNYTGWMGGGNFNDIPTPYRTAKNG
ncbi:hypothetical protein FEE96_22570 [Parasedimentitalea maritima]|uniref:Gluconate 2-dehydrogenase subunit 3 family protein n=1 Tax=Parasedimentitalea maritima TaxID=2578117 RepID=A0ABY2UNK5_9RHOB|nr:hypothetical protein [Zongyanglinia marina]TLP55504.1 hypothetical protein FEE96_22570 [Zongyanglinia marina]